MHRPRHQAGRRSTGVIAPECRGIRLPPENPRPEPLDATLFLRMLTPSTLSAIDVGAVNISARGRHSGGDSRIHPRRILIGLWLGLRRTGLEGRARTVTWLAIAVPLFRSHLAVWQFTRSGGFESRWSVAGAMVAPIPFAISVPLLIWIPALLRSKRIAAVLDAVSVALLLQSGARSGRAAARAWNVLGIVDLLVAIAIGALTTSGRLAVATPNTATRSYPLVMIPAFAVPLSLILHALSLRQLQGSARHRAASG